MKKNLYLSHVVLALAVLLVLPALVFAEASPNSGGAAALGTLDGVMKDVGPGQPEPNWGTTASIVYAVPAHQFQPIDSGVTYNYSLISTPGGQLGLYRTNATGNPWMEAPIHLPSGASIKSVEFSLCDSSATYQFYSFLTIGSKTVAISQPQLVTTTAAETPGCILRSFTFTTPVTVDNNDKFYSLEVNLGGTDGTIQLAGARIYYKLQVSPAPGTATFTDVPTSHPFFQYVEALAAAGITGGCGGGNYCPDSSVTRGQMAVFLSRALGLHWPN